MGSTKQSFGSAKRKASDTTQDAQGMAQEKMNEASKATKQAAESTRQKFDQATGETGNKADKVRLFVSLSPRRTLDVPSQGLNQFPPSNT